MSTKTIIAHLLQTGLLILPENPELKDFIQLNNQTFEIKKLFQESEYKYCTIVSDENEYIFRYDIINKQ